MDRKEVLRRAFIFSELEEGRDKYTNDPRDAGGPTKWGMALNYNRDIMPDKDGNGIIDENDVRLLEETDALVMYEKRYWRPNIKPEYPDALAFMLVDMMLNPGQGAAPKLLQKALNDCGQHVDVDGDIGGQTLAAVTAVAAVDLVSLLRALADQRLAYYQSRPKFPVFGRGWTGRTRRCLEAALQMRR